jgi:hypothetical protein
MSLIKIDKDKAAAKQAAEAEANRKAAYIAEADPLFFKYQRNEIFKEVWLEKIQEIKQRYPQIIPGDVKE